MRAAARSEGFLFPCAANGWQFQSGNRDNSVCPSLACLDVKMYNFLNSEACICTVDNLKAIKAYAEDAKGHLKTALIGAAIRIDPSMTQIPGLAAHLSPCTARCTLA